MIEISNQHFELLVSKLPRVLELARKQKDATLRLQEDIRQLTILQRKLSKKKQQTK